ncbi:CoA transferase [Salinirubellus salinus]|uniref:CoA transferase n=1 Tax=Salinirubellus salinus TaxID=1364945 RepID=A0A9E7R2B9_9EURY|nr:CoA transferase [Salinirubellus salinus]UWM54471.1 CoA transferase [Salinirubellus salinus]
MQRPLEDVRVLDLGHVYQGPYCGLILSFLGADVVKVEPPGGEAVRARSADGETPEVQFLNSNKAGLVLNLKTEEGKALLKDLVVETDVVVENFSPGKMDELGVGYDVLSEVNPRLVYGYGSGFGNTGAYKHYPAMDLTIQAMGGVMHTTGYPECPPVKAGPAVCDFLGGIHLAAGIVAALYRRERTGEGDYVEVGMFDCVYPTLTSPIASHIREEGAPPRTGNRHSGLAVAPYSAYAVDDGYVTIACMTDRAWERLVELMDRPELLDDERFTTLASRTDYTDEIDGMVEEWCDGQTKEEAVEQLRAANIPCAPVKTLEELLVDPQLEARGMLNRVPNKGGGRPEIPVPGMPIKFAGSEDVPVTDSPRVGEDSADVLARVLGLSAGEIDELRGAGVI